MKRHSIVLAFAAGALVFGAAQAQDASQLGTTLTPVGAEKAGNAAGTIPAWTGQVVKAAGGKDGSSYPDPFASDKPLFTITAADAEKYKANLTPGQLEMFKHYADYKMIVYPTHRSAVFPKAYNDDSIANAGRAKLSEDGNGFSGTSAGIAFPIPKNGNEAILSMRSRMLGSGTYTTHQTEVAVTRTGAYTPVEFEITILPQYNNYEIKPDQRVDNLQVYFLMATQAPARLAGTVLLVDETNDQTKEPRRAWTYNPGQRRVRLAPQVAYDNPSSSADGLRTSDDYGGFNGALDRYDWKLVGKKEIYIPYNSYKLSGHDVKIADLIKPGHLNQDVARYELHRVWIVDATLKSGFSHVYARRTFYIDEDSWITVLIDKYDARGELYRASEVHNIELYDFPLPYMTAEVNVDFPSGRYAVLGMRNESPQMHVPSSKTVADFTPEALRQEGTR